MATATAVPARKPRPIRVSAGEAMRILAPYARHQVREQIITVVPVCAFLALFQLLVLRQGLT